MGVDIYLNSIWDPWFEAHGKVAVERVFAEHPDSNDGRLAAFIAAIKAYESSGGYFHNAYSAPDVMFAMGLNWFGTVLPMLEGPDDHLPVGRARELIAMIEARPLTNMRLIRNFYLELTPPALDPDFEPLAAFLRTRREQLLAILRKSIEFDEPLLCSL